MYQTTKTLPRAIAIVGPTAAGKSQLAVEMSQRWQLPLLCCDSVQVYRRLDIGSAKPSLQEQARTPHFLLDLVDPDQEFSAGEYARHAHQQLAHGPGIFVGGTGFYLRAVVWSYSGNASVARVSMDNGERMAFTTTWQQQEQQEPGSAYRHLQELDAQTAQTIHPQNVPRIVRALWLCYSYKTPVSQIRQLDPPQKQISVAMVVLDPGVEVVDANIQQRCVRMLQNGWLEEVEQLCKAGYDQRYKSMRSLGYRQLLSVIQGEQNLQQAATEITNATRKYARKQRTYFRHQSLADRTFWLTKPEDCPWGELEHFMAGGWYEPSLA